MIKHGGALGCAGGNTQLRIKQPASRLPAEESIGVEAEAEQSCTCTADLELTACITAVFSCTLQREERNDVINFSCGTILYMCLMRVQITMPRLFLFGLYPIAWICYLEKLP